MKSKKIVTLSLSALMALSTMSTFSYADSSKVVTIGTNLSQTQKEQMLKYFGVKEGEAIVLEVNNQQERKYLEGVIPDAQIGTKTYSCAYVEPTSEDKVNVKTVNLSYVNSNMISSAFVTATGGAGGGANIIAGSPFNVSGTGALTGILVAMEDATGEKLDEEKKEIATEEMIVTGDIGSEIGQEKATGIVTDIKTEIIKNNTKDTVQIAETINNITNNYNVNLTEEQTKKLEELMQKISQQDYDYKEMKKTLENISKDVNSKLDEMGESVSTGILETVKGWFTGFGEWVSGMFSGNENLGILENTNDELLGDNVKIDATNKEAINLPSSEEVEGFFAKMWNSIKTFFEDLFDNSNSADKNEVENSEDAKKEPLFDSKPASDFEINNQTETQVDVNKPKDEEKAEENKNNSEIDNNSSNNEETQNSNTPSNEGSSETQSQE